jgi:hypothetical protein
VNMTSSHDPFSEISKLAELSAYRVLEDGA